MYLTKLTVYAFIVVEQAEYTFIACLRKIFAYPENEKHIKKE